MQIVVCDAGSISTLDALDLLDNFQSVLVADAAWIEVERHRPDLFSRTIRAFARVAPQSAPPPSLAALARLIPLHLGETQALQIAEEHGADDYGESYLQAEAIIARLVDEYNEQRLHAALGYMEPALWHRGDPQARRVERAQKLISAKALRRAINKQRQQEALAA